MSNPIEKPENGLLHPHDLREITELLIQHHGLSEGIFDLGVEFVYAIGPVGVGSEKTKMPGGIFGIKRIGLVTTDAANPAAVDAAIVNPVNPPKKRARKKTT